MITDGLLKFLLFLINGLWSRLPAWTIAVGPEAGFLGSWVKQWDNYVPVSEFFNVLAWTLAIFIAFHSLKWIVKVVDWIADVIP